MARRRYDAAVVERAAQMRERGITHREISELTGIPIGTLSAGILTRYAKADQSIRSAVLEVIRGNPGVASVDLLTLLRRSTRRAYSLHELQHVLGALRKQGLITLTEHQNGKARLYRHIEMARHAEPDEPSAEVTDTVPKPQAAWPVLDELRQHETERAETLARAQRFLEIATLLDGDDVPNVVNALMEAANDLVKQYEITRAEAEYLAYAHAHPAQEV